MRGCGREPGASFNSTGGNYAGTPRLRHGPRFLFLVADRHPTMANYYDQVAAWIAERNPRGAA
jgi:hypothetical protein